MLSEQIETDKIYDRKAHEILSKKKKIQIYLNFF